MEPIFSKPMRHLGVSFQTKKLLATRRCSTFIIHRIIPYKDPRGIHTSIGTENEIGAAIQEEKEVRAEEDEQDCNAEERRL